MAHYILEGCNKMLLWECSIDETKIHDRYKYNLFGDVERNNTTTRYIIESAMPWLYIEILPKDIQSLLRSDFKLGSDFLIMHEM